MQLLAPTHKYIYSLEKKKQICLPYISVIPYPLLEFTLHDSHICLYCVVSSPFSASFCACDGRFSFACGHKYCITLTCVSNRCFCSLRRKDQKKKSNIIEMKSSWKKLHPFLVFSFPLNQNFAIVSVLLSSYFIFLYFKKKKEKKERVIHFLLPSSYIASYFLKKEKKKKKKKKKKNTVGVSFYFLREFSFPQFAFFK